MKKFVVISMSVFLYLMTMIGLCKGTKYQQEKAKKEGRHIPYGPYEALIKRPMDIVVAGISLFLLFPFLGIISLILKFRLGSPILFQQSRLGLNNKVFKIVKFRTMTNQCGNNGELLPDEDRITSVGKWLRLSSIDELPELINVIKGDMSIVGPRPLLSKYLERYSEKQKHRHDVRPGLTGLAQISGRNSLSWDEKFEDDIKYVEKITLLGDLRIILKTAMVIWKKEGISAEGSATMPEFMGNRE